MIVKTKGYELEISKGEEIYLGSIKNGQVFINWAEIDEHVQTGLTQITEKIEKLIAESEKLLLSVPRA